jgi:hypothetical protein
VCNIVFVVGSPRSGTTYLSRALGLAEGAAYLGESALFCQGPARLDRGRYVAGMQPRQMFPYHPVFAFGFAVLDRVRGKDRVREAYSHLLRMVKVRSYDLKPSNTLYVEQGIELDRQDELDLGALSATGRQRLLQEGVMEYAKAYMKEFAHRRGCKTIVEKTPEHLRYLPMLHAVFPAARVVLIRRDKQDCLRSYLRTFGKGPGINRILPAPWARRKVWRELLADEKREQWAMQQPWVRSVEYGDFVEHPAEVLAGLAEWLELGFDFEGHAGLFAAAGEKQ